MLKRALRIGLVAAACVAGCGSDADLPDRQGGDASAGKGGTRASGGAGGRSGDAGPDASGASGGSAGAASGGSAGTTATGGSAGAATGGNAGAAMGGTAGAAMGGTAGAAMGGTAGAATGGAGGAAGSAGSAGTAGTGGGAGTGACGTITTFESGRSPSRELHVSTTGNDANNGASGSPVRTVNRALALANAGTAIRIHAGTYAGGAFRDGLAGSATAPIWIGGAPGEARPVIEGGGDAMHLVRARYVIVHDLEVRNTTANGINADDGSDYANADASRFLVFRNLYIHDIGSGGNQDCLKLSGLNDYFVLDSRFERCGGGGSGSAVDHVGCHKGLLARNVLEALQGNGIQCKGASDDIEVRWNRMLNAGVRAVNMGGSTGATFFRPPLSTTSPNYEARNIRVIANLFVGSEAPVAFVGCVNCLAANNTIVDPDNWVIRILQESVSDATYTFMPAQNGRFVNNLVYFNRSLLSTFVNVGANTQAATFVFRNNLWYAHDAPAQSQPSGLPAAETAGIYGTNPQLVAPASGNYAIPASSRAAGAGTALTELTGDITGKCWASPPSIGAYAP